MSRGQAIGGVGVSGNTTQVDEAIAVAEAGIFRE